jgi:hypothetical protein
MARLVFDGPRSGNGAAPTCGKWLPPENIMMIPCLQVWRRVGPWRPGWPRSDETLVDVAPSPPRFRLQAGGQRVVGFLVVRPSMLAR